MTKVNLLRIALIALIFVGMPFYWWAFPPRESVKAANGFYANPCCGTIALRDGQITTSDKRYMRYVVEHDKVGRYVLPETYVGATKRGVVFRRNGYPINLYLDRTAPPQYIELTDDMTGEVFIFSRLNGS